MMKRPWQLENKQNPMGRFVRYGLAWGYTLACSAVACSFLAAKQPVRGWTTMMHPWAWGMLRLTGIRMEVQGAEYLAGPAVFACNHQSIIDVILLPALAPAQVRIIAKRELARIPLWGWILAKAGGVMIDRQKSRSAIEAIQKGVATLPPGWSVAIFPEGTRSFSGNLLPFKKGACHIAMAAKLPIVPIGIDGAQHVASKGEVMPRRGVVQVTVGRPIDTADWRSDTVDEHSAELFDAINACLSVSRQRLRQRQRMDADPTFVGLAS